MKQTDQDLLLFKHSNFIVGHAKPKLVAWLNSSSGKCQNMELFVVICNPLIVSENVPF